MESENETDTPQVEIALPTNDPSTATADWIKTNPTTTKIVLNGSQPRMEYTPVSTIRSKPTYPDDKTGEPKKADFLVPETRAEHESMVDRLIKGGSLLGEAEQIIALRSIAFNKACREQKKLAGKPSKWVEKSKKGQSNKKNQSKHVSSMEVENVN